MTSAPKHIGIVACSAEGAALCYRTICEEAPVFMGAHQHPEVSMHTYSLGDYMSPIYKNDWTKVASMMRASARKLVKIGAELLICPDNTIHQCFQQASSGLDTPWLHIAEVVIGQAESRGFYHLGVLGTKYLMKGPVYKDAASGNGFEISTPGDDDQEHINSIIFDELVYGKIQDQSRKELIRIITRMKERGCKAVVLGCTELPLILNDDVSPLPTLDSTRLLARAAIHESLKRNHTREK